MKIISKIIELLIDGSKSELETKLNYIKSKYQVISSDIYYNNYLSCYTMQVKYVEKGIY